MLSESSKSTVRAPTGVGSKVYEKNREWVEKNKEKVRLYHKEYYQRPEVKERRRQLYQKNIKRHRELDRAHYHRTKDRHSELRISRRFGISVEEYRSLCLLQRNLCAICGKPERAIHKRYGTPKVLAVDHSHKTGKIRGLLCQNCNNAIGHIHEDISLLEKIRIYLERYA